MDTSKIEKRIPSDKLQLILLDDISRKLSKEIKLLGNVYAELISEGDEGEYLILKKTATSTEDITFMKDLLGHYIKGYTIKNDGLIDISIGHNGDLSKRYTTVSTNTQASFSFNRKKIKSIYIKTDSGTSNYTLTLTW